MDNTHDTTTGLDEENKRLKKELSELKRKIDGRRKNCLLPDDV